MDFIYDGVYNSFIYSCFYNFLFLLVLSQMFCEFDIDISIYKFFEGLLEIFEDYFSVVICDVDVMWDVVIVVVLFFFLFILLV